MLTTRLAGRAPTPHQGTRLPSINNKIKNGSKNVTAKAITLIKSPCHSGFGFPGFVVTPQTTHTTKTRHCSDSNSTNPGD